MKQIIQNYRSGKLALTEVPAPSCSRGRVLVQNQASLISLGTERSIIELGQKSLLGKARARPDLVRRFIQKVENEGLVKAYKEAMHRLDTPTPLGYSSAGLVLEVGENVGDFSPGDRVACIGQGYASHAEYVTVPENLCARIPEGVSYEEASFGMLGIIAMHGLRCAKLTPGSTAVVTGLGLLGLLAVQMLKAYGMRVIGMDVDPAKAELAKKLGADLAFVSDSDLREGVHRFADGLGVDAVLIAAATKSAQPVDTAVDVVRFGGRIVLIGVADIHPHRNEMWHKEVEIIVSRAGGPGTFDPIYENKGIDYPIDMARWTENRNLQEFLRLVGEGRVRVSPLLSHRAPFSEAEEIYARMIAGEGGPYVGVVLNYPEADEQACHPPRNLTLGPEGRAGKPGAVGLGVIGAGLFGRSLLLPALKGNAEARLEAMATQTGANAQHMGAKYGFASCTSDYKEVLDNPNVDAVLILTPHSVHAKMVQAALSAGKHVYVEKPLCINREELEGIKKAYESAGGELHLLVGYNRRFSPHAARMADVLVGRRDPMMVSYRINAGYVPPDHWVHSEEEGGSRVIGEVCHFIDMLQFLTNSDPTRIFAQRFSGGGRTSIASDNLVLQVKMSDGSLGNVVYSASGDRALPRERIEVFTEGRSLVLDDYRRLECYIQGKKKVHKSSSQQMGYKEELDHFIQMVQGRALPRLTPREAFLSTLTTFAINESLESGRPVDL